MSVTGDDILNVCEVLETVRYADVTLSENFNIYLIQTTRIIIIIIIIIKGNHTVE
jgi:hypothetical protein